MAEPTPLAAPTPLAVYIHWPYCSRICPYCDFNVYKGAENADLVKAIISDLEYWRQESGARELNSIHFGGGTPSLMRGQDVGRLLETVDSLWGLPASIEIGLEANPNDFNQTRWSDFAAAGVNRLSLGVQSFEDRALQFLGREHDGNTARNVTEQALDIFQNVSVDLIYGLYGHDLSRDTERAIATGIQHISTYQLTIEDGTAFHRAEQRGQIKAVDSDKSATEFEAFRDALMADGFDRYEISNWARPGFESCHNLAYWRGYDYVGVGPGAHGRLTEDGHRKATIAQMRPDVYIAAVDRLGSGVDQVENLSPEDWAAEYVMMGLRTREGLSLERLGRIADAPLDGSSLQMLLDEGFLSKSATRLAATNKGRDVLDYITGKLLT